jgi:hypothetical protein
METGTHHPDPIRTPSATTGEAKEKAAELTRTARDRALSTLDQQKSQLGGLLERIADTIKDDRLGGFASEYARRGAELLHRRSADDIFRSVRSGIRSRPGVVLSACFVAGLAFARLMKGSASEGGWGDRERFDEGRFDAGRWQERGYGESGDGGYGEGSIAGPDRTRGGPLSEGPQP